MLIAQYTVVMLVVILAFGINKQMNLVKDMQVGGEETQLSWWIFGLAGCSVLLVSVLSVSLQSWRAASVNPVKAIKMG